MYLESYTHLLYVRYACVRMCGDSVLGWLTAHRSFYKKSATVARTKSQFIKAIIINWFPNRIHKQLERIAQHYNWWYNIHATLATNKFVIIEWWQWTNTYWYRLITYVNIVQTQHSTPHTTDHKHSICLCVYVHFYYVRMWLRISHRAHTYTHMWYVYRCANTQNTK